MNLLPTLLNQLGDGGIERLGVVVDADYEAEHGLGYHRTIDRVAAIVREFGFAISDGARNRAGGLLFEHSDGLPEFGLWVMPGNLHDGLFEDWLKNCIAEPEGLFIRHAEAAIANLPSRRFKPIHQIKAEIATWLAWQRLPGRWPDYAITEGLINTASQEFLLLAKWLKSIYA